MPNAFDSANYPEREPDELIVGDRWLWKRTDLGTDYPPASYSLKYSLRLEGTGATEIEITANESGSDYLVEVASVTTAGYTSGRYRWQAYITRTSDSQRVTIATGIFDVKPNRDAATTDPRSHARKTLDAIETAIEALNLGVKSYTINNRSMTKRDIPELLMMRDKYRSEVRREDDAERIRRGLGAKNRLLVRFK